MRDVVEGGRGYVALCQCCCCNRRAGDLEFCEPCLQAVKQCPPKKRFMRAGGMKPRPIIVKPASCIALDRLVEVALSPTDFDATKSYEFLSSPKESSKVGDGPATPTASENRVRRSDGEGSAMESSGCKKTSPNRAMVPPSPEIKLPRYSLPLEAVQKLKRLSSLDELPQPRSSKVVHRDHSKKFTPRFKSLLDISC
ncbi:hypothetical protein M758_3G183400 [Ceratodon purpureus]|nr:hypothetical protein M758_3G183400 [Ceratodon purpureus]